MPGVRNRCACKDYRRHLMTVASSGDTYDYWSAVMVPDAALATLSDLVARPAWMRFASCRGTDPAWYHLERGGNSAPARKVCADCTVRLACLEYALERPGLEGIWGGTSDRERKLRRRAMRRASA